MGKNRMKSKAAKQARKAAYGIKAGRTDAEKQELNPRVPYQRRKLDRRAGRPMAARPPPVQRWINVPDGLSRVRVVSPGFESWLALTRYERRMAGVRS
jgi:hypothetical protein